MDVIYSALQDDDIRQGHRYAMFQRAQKICTTLSNKLQQRWSQFEHDVMICVQKAPEVHAHKLRTQSCTCTSVCMLSAANSHVHVATCSALDASPRAARWLRRHVQRAGCVATCSALAASSRAARWLRRHVQRAGCVATCSVLAASPRAARWLRRHV